MDNHSTAYKECDKKAVGNTAGNQSRKKLIAALVVVSVIMSLSVFFICTHAVLGNVFGGHEIFFTSTEKINLSGSDYKDYSPLSKVKSLEVIDLTNSSFTGLSDLYGCKNLKKVILKGKVMEAEDCIDFYRNVPGAILVSKVRINGQIYDSDIAELKAEGADKETQRLFAALGNLAKLDMTSCEVDDDTYQYLSGALSDCQIVIRTEIGGKEYKTPNAWVSSGISSFWISKTAPIPRC